MTVQSDEVRGAIRQAHIDRAKMAARMLATIYGVEYIVAEIAGMAGVFHVATDEALRRKQDKDELGTYETHFRAVPFEDQPPTVEKIEYRLGCKVFVMSNGVLIYDQRVGTGEFVVSEGVLTSLPLASALAHLYGGIVRVRTFPEAVIVAALFGAGMAKPEYRVLVQTGILRVG